MGFHHAIWKRPDGRIIDVTKRLDGLDGGTTFAPEEPQIRYDLRSPPGQPQAYLPLTRHIALDQFLSTDRALHQLQKAKQDEILQIPNASYNNRSGLFEFPVGENRFQELNMRYDQRILELKRQRNNLFGQLVDLRAKGKLPAA